MTRLPHALGRGAARRLGPLLLWLALAVAARAQLVVTNLHQLTLALNLEPQLYCDVRLDVTVCAASRPPVGVLIVRDDSGVELLELDRLAQQFRPGETAHIQGDYCLARRRGLGIGLSPQPAADNDGIHLSRSWNGQVTLPAGLNPLRVEWFNNLREFNLELQYSVANAPFAPPPAASFFHAATDAPAGRTNFLPGLAAAAYEGTWERMPNFNLLQPMKTGVVSNLDLSFRPRDERTAIRFTGFFDAPTAGDYTFRLRSDDGSLLFLGHPEVRVTSTGFTAPPAARTVSPGIFMNRLTDRRWVTVSGRVGMVTRRGAGVEFDLTADQVTLPVRVADAAGLDLSRLRNARVQVTGVGRGALAMSGRIVLGALFAAGANEIQFLEPAAAGPPALPLASVAAVQSLPLDEARRALPVLVRGVVTDSKDAIYERMLSIQDDTRGIFVVVRDITNSLPPFGEAVEVRGRSGAGDFAPVIIADQITPLGAGRLPPPAQPAWRELLNGSRDVQWAEIRGLVTAAHGHTLSLLLPEGTLDVVMDGYGPAQLAAYVKSVVRLRGVLFAQWNAATREVQVGSVLMRHAAIGVEVPAPADPFDAVVKTPRDLLRFDSQASAFRRVKVRGQAVYVDAVRIFLEADGAGLRVLPAEKNSLRAGDEIEAVGYPDIRRAALLLRDAHVRRTGANPPPAPKVLTETNWNQDFLDATRVRLAGQLIGEHHEDGATVLEMQSGTRLYLARISPAAKPVFLRPGSRLRLTGVYVNGAPDVDRAAGGAFEILLNSPADVAVLAQPSWWTLPRLLMLVGGLLVGLAIAAVWITQLRRLVGRRTAQLRVEIGERERVERQRAVEAERTRIARDLHDDLGASLTEISALAGTGQRRPVEAAAQNLFQVIAGKARQLIAALDVIVWAVDPEENSLQSFADYVTGHAEDFFAHTGIACRFQVPVAVPNVRLGDPARHDLLLAVKEALNNVARHAGATEVEFRLAVTPGELSIEIADNGKGFAGGSGGHGLKNLPARLEKLGGACVIESRPGGGTTVKLRAPLPAAEG